MRDDRDISKRLGIKYQMDLPLLVNRAAVSIMSWPEAKAYCAGGNAGGRRNWDSVHCRFVGRASRILSKRPFREIAFCRGRPDPGLPQCAGKPQGLGIPY